MTATYDPSLSNNISRIRLLLGDTSTAEAQLSDEEITAMYTIAGSVYDAGARLADSLAAKYARRVDMDLDGFRINYSRVAKHYQDLAARLRAEALTSMAGGLGVPFAGGTSQSGRETAEQDTDRVVPKFTSDMHEVPGTYDAGDAP